MSCVGNRPEVRPANPGELARHKPDAHFDVVGDKGVCGRCSLWWNGTPAWKEHRVGMIGHYSASGEGAGALLNHACRQLAEQGCTLAVGPMDGSTWRPYRLITRFGDEPRFFLEPDNPAEWVEHFSDSGFEPLARYFSALNADLARTDPRIERHAAHLHQTGITVRPIRGEAFVEDLRRMFTVAQAAFRGNLFYCDPDETEFVQTYRPLLGKVPLELILLAEQAGRPLGFAFAVPDLNEQERGEPVKTMIVKTLAALPHRRCAGLGQWLLAEVQRRAHLLGFSRAILALVRDTGHLRRISGRYARPIREYTLFAKVLPR
jgi:GNAT superfamily N-acetyltransferase